MPINSSSLFGSFLPVTSECFFSEPSFHIFVAFTITNILLLLPLCIFILHHGLQQWRQKRSASSVASLSHSDGFTYHTVAMDLISVCGCVFFLCGVYKRNLRLLFMGIRMMILNWFGQVLFHNLTCVERYLAVVHPITYLSLRNQRGIRIRNISIACLWLLSFVGMGLVMMETVLMIITVCILVLSLLLISFCSLSILCVLIRPGPGEQGGGREKVDQSKLRAFHTIVAILGALVVGLAWSLGCTVLYILGDPGYCVVMVFQFWFNLPNSLVLPLLFLHREGKLVCWKKSIK